MTDKITSARDRRIFILLGVTLAIVNISIILRVMN